MFKRTEVSVVILLEQAEQREDPPSDTVKGLQRLFPDARISRSETTLLISSVRAQAELKLEPGRIVVSDLSGREDSYAFADRVVASLRAFSDVGIKFRAAGLNVEYRSDELPEPAERRLARIFPEGATITAALGDSITGRAVSVIVERDDHRATISCSPNDVGEPEGRIRCRVNLHFDDAKQFPVASQDELLRLVRSAHEMLTPLMEVLK